MSFCKEYGEDIPEEQQEIHAQEIHPELCDQKLEEYISDSVRDAAEELFGQ